MSTTKVSSWRKYWRLGVWATIRLLFGLILLAWPVALFVVVYEDALNWSPTTASVVGSHSMRVGPSGRRHQLDVTITFVSPDGNVLETNVEPNSLRTVKLLQRIPVRYRRMAQRWLRCTLGQAVT